MRSIFHFDLIALQKEIVKLGLKKNNAIQIFKHIYIKKNTAFDNLDIAHSSIDILKKNLTIDKLKIVKIVETNDKKIVKFLFRLSDKNLIEAVFMKFNYGCSVCLSTQVGCNMGCKFCASGLLKKIRNLEVEEIIMQFMSICEYFPKEKITNIVIMGIGEPFDNYINLCKALDIFVNHYGLAIGERHITVSTCGIIDKIIKFAKDKPKINLAISLHAPNQQIREKLMPISHKFTFNELIKAIWKYQRINKQKQVTIEYILP